MKADNEPAISLPVYFKSVKMENMFFDKKKKKKKKRKKKRKIKFPTVGVGPRTFFFLTRGRSWTRIPNYEYMNDELQYTKRKRHQKRINQAAICQLRMIHLIKIPPFHTWVCDSCQ